MRNAISITLPAKLYVWLHREIYAIATEHGLVAGFEERMADPGSPSPKIRRFVVTGSSAGAIAAASAIMHRAFPEPEIPWALGRGSYGARPVAGHPCFRRPNLRRMVAT